MRKEEKNWCIYDQLLLLFFLFIYDQLIDDARVVLNSSCASKEILFKLCKQRGRKKRIGAYMAN